MRSQDVHVVADEREGLEVGLVEPEGSQVTADVIERDRLRGAIAAYRQEPIATHQNTEGPRSRIRLDDALRTELRRSAWRAAVVRAAATTDGSLVRASSSVSRGSERCADRWCKAAGARTAAAGASTAATMNTATMNESAHDVSERAARIRWDPLLQGCCREA